MKLKSRKIVSLLLCMMLIVAMAFVTTGCNGNNNETTTTTASSQNNSVDCKVVGEGQTSFTLSVIDKEGNETKFEVHTDKTTVGAALLENDLISGEEGPYGLYIKAVNGITADFDTDGTYWAFYINGEYAMTGVDTTDIVEGDVYSLKVEKG